jgi:hypothetical protein
MFGHNLGEFFANSSGHPDSELWLAETVRRLYIFPWIEVDSILKLFKIFLSMTKSSILTSLARKKIDSESVQILRLVYCEIL